MGGAFGARREAGGGVAENALGGANSRTAPGGETVAARLGGGGVPELAAAGSLAPA